jgi:integrase
VFVDDEHGEIYQYRFTIHGKQRKGSTGQRDSTAAQTEANRLYGLAITGKKPPQKKRPVKHLATAEDLARLYATFVASLVNKRSEYYVRDLESDFSAHFAHRWRTIEEMIAPGAIDAYASDRLNGQAPAFELKPRRPRPKKVSSVSVHKELSSLRAFLKWAKKMGIIDEIPHIEPVSQISDYKPPDYLPEDVRKLLKAMPTRHTHRWHHPVQEFFTVQWSQANRPGEVETLRVCDVNLNQREMTIRQSVDKARIGRTIALSDEAFSVLKSMLHEREWVRDALIFGAHDYRVSVKKAAEACGLPRPTRHNLRHFRLTELGHLPGIEPAALQFLAGHKRMATTDLYVRSRTKATEKLFAAAGEFKTGTGLKKKSPRREDLPDFATVKSVSRRRTRKP